ncbi:MAG: hypothetical protein M3R24_03970 [Chloroflexota bacterium]|nr:hypothetical protein [Chloroflexota bacterium]
MKAPGYSSVLNRLLARQRTAPRYVTNFDSAAAFVRAIGRFLRGRDFPGMGITPASAKPIATVVNQLPARVKETLYTYSSYSESIPTRKLHKVDAEAVATWITNEYPQRPYPAIAIGSSSGALVHLFAALGMPFLPQTFMIPVAHPNLHVDEPQAGMEWGAEQARPLLDANPELQLHHMWDPNQDRLTLAKMTYFRVKWLKLAEAYKQFIAEHVPEGGRIFVVECQRVWPTTKVDDRHIFQFGALGGAPPDEFFQGSERVEQYLERYGSHRRRWEPPQPDAERPEAEWGFEPALRAELEQFARRHGYRLQRVVFQEPEHLSPLVADLYRWWYDQRRMLANRLLAESFILLEPYWALRTGSVPFWMKFNMQPSLDWIMQYLDNAEPYDEIFMMLFSHGVESVGLPTITQWREVLQRAYRRGEFLGVDEATFPRHFISITEYYNELRSKVAARYPMPAPLTLSQLDRFLEHSGDRYPVQWLDNDVWQEHPIGSEDALQHVRDLSGGQAFPGG